MPSGLIGVLVAALLSGLMSQISGALNSISTMVSYDIFRQRKPAASDGQLIRIGKLLQLLPWDFPWLFYHYWIAMRVFSTA
ncbi:sodium:solute symporter family transporter [Sphingobacterium multivorum]|uniref:sodium:solute symporter family transporter n=1 Tax=Sphingobacterium multivorum TaxID=28454 RepID=UPI00211543F1|nr:hypothetical protein [Sphingobacterium multivorum]